MRINPFNRALVRFLETSYLIHLNQLNIHMEYLIEKPIEHRYILFSFQLWFTVIITFLSKYISFHKRNELNLLPERRMEWWMTEWIQSLSEVGYNFRYVSSFRHLNCFIKKNKLIPANSGSERSERRGRNCCRINYSLQSWIKRNLKLIMNGSNADAIAEMKINLNWDNAAAKWNGMECNEM